MLRIAVIGYCFNIHSFFRNEDCCIDGEWNEILGKCTSKFRVTIVFQNVYILRVCYAQYNFEYNLKQVLLQLRA